MKFQVKINEGFGKGMHSFRTKRDALAFIDEWNEAAGNAFSRYAVLMPVRNSWPALRPNLGD